MSNPKPLMKCGHISSAKNLFTGDPSCPICAGSTPFAEQQTNPDIDLSTRRARCKYFGEINYSINESKYGCRKRHKCDCEANSSMDLPFFELQLMADFDIFYCGCKGWEQQTLDIK